MLEDPLVQTLLLLGAAVAAVALCQRLHTPPVLGYLLVGVVLGPFTPGPVIEGHQLRVFAEYGIVFLLFGIGLGFSLPQLRVLRHAVLGLGAAQVLLTTAAVGLLAWQAGLPPAAAFVVGAVFAQSSTTIISRQLEEQHEEHSRHGRLAVAMSVFQDITAVPFVVIIPVLAAAPDLGGLAGALGWAGAKAVLAFAAVWAAGRWLLRPFFYVIAARRSPEVFTLTVLFVSLTAAWVTSSLGLSMAFGAFLVGMMLGETEFRHQIEAAIRPFRDVLLGLFFIGIGMLFDLGALPEVWPQALAGALVLLAAKTLVVAPAVRLAGIDTPTAWRTALVLAVGGEFGFALLAIAVEAGVIAGPAAQVVLMSVLVSMFIAPLLIRYNGPVADALAVLLRRGAEPRPLPAVAAETLGGLDDHVIICGYGRVGHAIATLMQGQAVTYVAYDQDPARVAQGARDGHQVLYGDCGDLGLYAAAHAERAALVVITTGDAQATLRTVALLRSAYPRVPILVRARDLEQTALLLKAGATQAYPEAVEASLRLGALALEMVGAAPEHVDLLVQSVRDEDYAPVREDPQGGRVNPDQMAAAAVAASGRADGP